MIVVKGGVGGVLCASASSPGGRVVGCASPPHSNFASTFAKRLLRLQSCECSPVERKSEHFSVFRRTLHNECQQRRSLDQGSDDKIRRKCTISLPSTVTRLLLERLNEAKLKREWCAVRIGSREMVWKPEAKTCLARPRCTRNDKV